jgi:DNA-binding MarR family transcriptional regulator
MTGTYRTAICDNLRAMTSHDSRVLHTLRCVGTTSVERLGRASGLGEGVVTDSLHRLAEEGFVELAPGPFGGWSVTDRGRGADIEWLTEELETTGTGDSIRRCYEAFLELNPKVLQVCSDWQMRRIGTSFGSNDHDDPEYDSEVLDRLVGLDSSAQQTCGDLAERLERFEIYGLRLSGALQRAMAGEIRFVADDLDSYHNVWFQLHEDLITTLGLSREEERRRIGGG